MSEKLQALFDPNFKLRLNFTMYPLPVGVAIVHSSNGS